MTFFDSHKSTLLWLGLLGFRDYDGALFVHGATPCATWLPTDVVKGFEYL